MVDIHLVASVAAVVAIAAQMAVDSPCWIVVEVTVLAMVAAESAVLARMAVEVTVLAMVAVESSVLAVTAEPAVLAKVTAVVIVLANVAVNIDSVVVVDIETYDTPPFTCEIDSKVIAHEYNLNAPQNLVNMVAMWLRMSKYFRFRCCLPTHRTGLT